MLNYYLEKENWINYKLEPYGYNKTGHDPKYKYNLPRYRKPYRFGYKFEQSYPRMHLRYHD